MVVMRVKQIIRTIARRVRRLPALKDADLLWDAVRKPYHLVLGLGGIEFVIADKVAVRIPPAFAKWQIGRHEPETIGALVEWLQNHPGGLFIDVGSHIGMFSATALFFDKTAEVIAFDADIGAVPAINKFCRYAPRPGRLTAIYGLITDEAPMTSLAEAVRLTALNLTKSKASGDFGQSVRKLIAASDRPAVDLHSASAQIPRYRLDDLLPDVINGRPSLIKCDVEGAELFVLRGARRLLSEFQPSLLLSVHCSPHSPQVLAQYGHTASDVRSFLESMGYHIQLLAIDHEEHWWCETLTSPASELKKPFPNYRRLPTVSSSSTSAEPKPLRHGVVLAANENPFYSFFVPLVTKTWKQRIGVDAVLVLLTRNVPSLVIEATVAAGGIPILVDSRTWPASLGTGRLMQNVRTLGAAAVAALPEAYLLAEETVLTTTDADIFPLNRTYFALPRAPEENMTEHLVVRGNHPGTLHMNQYPLCYLSMTVKQWRQIMDLENLTLNEALLRLYYEHGTELSNIYFDQDYFYRQVQKHRAQHPQFRVTLVPWKNERRLDFRLWRDLNYDAQPEGFWLDSPALRPGFTRHNWPRFKEGLLLHLFDAETMRVFERFREAFVQEVMEGDEEAHGLKDGFGRDS
jgi:FkbM family methyltransferase